MTNPHIKNNLRETNYAKDKTRQKNKRVWIGFRSSRSRCIWRRRAVCGVCTHCVCVWTAGELKILPSGGNVWQVSARRDPEQSQRWHQTRYGRCWESTKMVRSREKALCLLHWRKKMRVWGRREKEQTRRTDSEIIRVVFEKWTRAHARCYALTRQHALKKWMFWRDFKGFWWRWSGLNPEAISLQSHEAISRRSLAHCDVQHLCFGDERLGKLTCARESQSLWVEMSLFTSNKAEHMERCGGAGTGKWGTACLIFH